MAESSDVQFVNELNKWAIQGPQELDFAIAKAKLEKNIVEAKRLEQVKKALNEFYLPVTENKETSQIYSEIIGETKKTIVVKERIISEKLITEFKKIDLKKLTSLSFPHAISQQKTPTKRSNILAKYYDTGASITPIKTSSTVEQKQGEIRGFASSPFESTLPAFKTSRERFDYDKRKQEEAKKTSEGEVFSYNFIDECGSRHHKTFQGGHLIQHEIWYKQKNQQPDGTLKEEDMQSIYRFDDSGNIVFHEEKKFKMCLK